MMTGNTFFQKYPNEQKYLSDIWKQIKAVANIGIPVIFSNPDKSICYVAYNGKLEVYFMDGKRAA